MNDPILQLKDITRVYQQGGHTLTVLKGVNLAVKAGEMVGLVGASGSGKSTLLHLAGLLEPPTQGEVSILGQSMAWASDEKRTLMRLTTIGFVYQFHHLMPEFSALENIMIPQLMRGVKASQAKEHAMHLLERVGLRERITHRPAQLSGGEQQRVAIVRALANNPKLLLADEPTGNLDEGTAESVFAELIGLVKEKSLAVLIVTHDKTLAGRMDRVLTLQHGRL